jgi:hypothetical protein
MLVGGEGSVRAKDEETGDAHRANGESGEGRRVAEAEGGDVVLPVGADDVGLVAAAVAQGDFEAGWPGGAGAGACDHCGARGRGGARRGQEGEKGGGADRASW